MPKGSKFRERIYGLFDSHPTGAFQVSMIYQRLPGISKSVVDYWLRQFLKDETVIKPKYGWYQKNPSTIRTIDEIRTAAQELGEARVFQSEVPFRVTEQAIVQGPHPALESRRLHFFSIIDRMSSDPHYSKFDIELLQQEIGHLTRAEPKKFPATSG